MSIPVEDHVGPQFSDKEKKLVLGELSVEIGVFFFFVTFTNSYDILISKTKESNSSELYSNCVTAILCLALHGHFW